MRRAVLLTSACLLVLIAGGCRHDGRTLRPAGPGQQSSISASSAAPLTTDDAAFEPVGSGATFPSAGLKLVAPWRDGATIDARYTCDGMNVAPALSWSAAPAGTVELALVLTDTDAPTFVHWMMAGIPRQNTSINERTVPLGAYEAKNGHGVIGYTGPCPPAGTKHTYVITVYYLGESPGLSDGAIGPDMLDAILGAEIDEASVMATFSRP